MTYDTSAADYVPQAPKALEFADELAQQWFADWRAACQQYVRAQRRLVALRAKGVDILDARYRAAREARSQAQHEADEAYNAWQSLASLRGLPLSRDAEKRQEAARKGR